MTGQTWPLECALARVPAALAKVLPALHSAAKCLFHSRALRLLHRFQLLSLSTEKGQMPFGASVGVVSFFTTLGTGGKEREKHENWHAI